MTTYTFKTNINCGGCIEKVTPYLDNLEGIQNWEVDTSNKNKILKVNANDQVDRSMIESAVQEAGFEIKPRKEGVLGKLFG